MASKPFLKYIGGGSYVPGLPAHDLTEKEAKQYNLAALLATGLYEEINEPVKPVKEAGWQKELES